MTVTNAFGQSLRLDYDAQDRLASVNASGGRAVRYGYDSSGNLGTATAADGQARSYLYENPAFPGGLTGIVDEAGQRMASFAYDAQRRAITTELVGNVNRYQVSYPAADTATVIDPIGTARTYRFSSNAQNTAVTSGSLPSANDHVDAASRVQDASGLVTSDTDFTGVRTDYTWNTARRLPLTITKAAGTPQAQVTRYDWHPVFSLPVLVTEAERTTAFEYDAQGNLLSQSIAAAAGTTAGTTVGPARRTQWTYNPQGLVASRTDPNGARTTYTYDPFGNPILARNALGHETRASYDAANRIAT
ncbi:conserved hypothetical protein [Burkholderiales bacterium 8X]|nr:conserved hypothetical protein [Burkholderiales bacterium 8X]